MYCILNGGFGQLINKMVKVVKEKHSCFLNSECQQIFYNDGIFTININDKKVFTKNLVLAIPQPNLLDLKFLISCLIKVVLPEPVEPTIATFSPLFILRFNLSKTGLFSE